MLQSFLEVELLQSAPSVDRKTVFKEDRHNSSFEVYTLNNETYILINTHDKIFHLKDLRKNSSAYHVYIIFVVLILMQIFLYFKIRQTLKPLNTINVKLINLQKGDISLLDAVSPYLEISNFIVSYNNAIAKIKSMLSLREMFNKVFAHEMKMPIAKGMFYLKKEPSVETNEKIKIVFNVINKQLDDFSLLETAVLGSKLESTKNNLIDILNNSITSFNEDDIKHIKIITIPNGEPVWFGNSELWAICFKNLIDNALKYSIDKKVEIKIGFNYIEFLNYGEELPIVSNDFFTIDKTKQNKSSSGYGFGLFIIKAIVEFEEANLSYNYEENKIKISIQSTKN